MCGIIGVVSRTSTRSTPSSEEVLDHLDQAVAAIGDLSAVTEPVLRADRLLRGVPGILALNADPALSTSIVARLDELDVWAEQTETELESNENGVDPTSSSAPTPS